MRLEFWERLSQSTSPLQTVKYYLFYRICPTNEDPSPFL